MTENCLYENYVFNELRIVFLEETQETEASLKRSTIMLSQGSDQSDRRQDFLGVCLSKASAHRFKACTRPQWDTHLMTSSSGRGLIKGALRPFIERQWTSVSDLGLLPNSTSSLSLDKPVNLYDFQVSLDKKCEGVYLTGLL